MSEQEQLAQLRDRVNKVCKICEALDDEDIVFFMANKDRIFKDIVSVLRNGRKWDEIDEIAAMVGDES